MMNAMRQHLKVLPAGGEGNQVEGQRARVRDKHLQKRKHSIYVRYKHPQKVKY